MANRINKIISTKANTLYAMKNLIKKASIGEMYILRVEDFWRNKNQVCTEIMEKFGGMTEIMPVPRNSHITVLRPPSIAPDFIVSYVL